MQGDGWSNEDICVIWRIREGIVYMQVIDEKLSNRIANLGFVSACLVVGIHLAGGPVKIPWICGCAVPIFFFISGFLLAGNCEKPIWYKMALRKRVKTLLIPYVVVCGCWYPILFVMHELAVKFAGATPGTMPITWRTPFDVFGLFFYGGPISIGMWYIRALLILVVVSPLLVYLIRKSKVSCQMTVLITMLLWIGYKYRAWLGISFNEWWNYFFTFGVPFYGIACFTLGMAFRLRGNGHIWAIVPSGKWPSWLVSNAFPLFIIHPMVIYFIEFGFKGLHRLHWFHSYPGYVGGLIILIPGICALAQVLKIKLPRVASIIFGGR